MFELEVETTFSAAHALRGYQGKCENLHGHNYRVQLTIAGTELDEIGLLVDFKEIKRILQTSITALDHTYLNDLDTFCERNASAENIAHYLYHSIAPKLADASAARAKLLRVKVWENDCTAASFVALPQLPE